jgi:hypothetical protein
VKNENVRSKLLLERKMANAVWLLSVFECGCCCFSKCFLFRKNISIIFFYFLKIIFNISTSK